jgi:hypothetical protein
MAQQRALVRNAADPQQVRFAERKEKERAGRFLDALAAILRTPAGRIVVWELLVRARIFGSIWDPSAKIHYNAGRQDFGHELLASCLDADDEAYQLMEREMRAWQRGQDRETAAIQTPAAAQTEDL